MSEFDLGEVIKQWTFANKDYTKGTLMLCEDRYKAECMRPRGWYYQIAYTGIERFRVHSGVAGRTGIWINRWCYRVKYPEEWMEAIKKALTAKGIKFKQSESYSIVE